jgi:hypothetical protein
MILLDHVYRPHMHGAPPEKGGAGVEARDAGGRGRAE